MDEAKEQINLRVLSKYDDSIKALLKTISHVVLYDFNMKEQQWVFNLQLTAEQKRYRRNSVCL
jgi:hypothetical protein